jgi:hypothetical protein
VSVAGVAVIVAIPASSATRRKMSSGTLAATSMSSAIIRACASMVPLSKLAGDGV